MQDESYYPLGPSGRRRGGHRRSGRGPGGDYGSLTLMGSTVTTILGRCTILEAVLRPQVRSHWQV
jgi:hypothetical protein